MDVTVNITTSMYVTVGSGHRCDSQTLSRPHILGHAWLKILQNKMWLNWLTVHRPVPPVILHKWPKCFNYTTITPVITGQTTAPPCNVLQTGCDLAGQFVTIRQQKKN